MMTFGVKPFESGVGKGANAVTPSKSCDPIKEKLLHLNYINPLLYRYSF